MGIWSQHILVILLVAACLFFVGRQAFASVRGKGKLGNCCARGCQPTDQPKPAGTAFIPSDSLRMSRHRQSQSAK